MVEKIIEQPLVDLRLILEYTQNVASVFGLLLNVFLLYLIFFKTSKHLMEYKVILLQNCMVDMLFAVINDITKVQVESKNGSVFLLITGAFSKISFPLIHIIGSIWVVTLFCCITSIPVQFIYRYYMIVLEKKLTLLKYFGFFALSALGALSYGGMYCYFFWYDPVVVTSDHSAKKALLEADPYFFREIPAFFVQDMDHWPLRIIYFYASLLVVVSYGITIYANVKVWKKLSQLGSLLSQTHKTHKQMTKTIILQAVIPLTFVMAPTSAIVVATVLRLDIRGLGVAVSIFWCLIPVVNPLATIFSISIYRQAVFKALKLKKFTGSVVKTSRVHTTGSILAASGSVPK